MCIQSNTPMQYEHEALMNELNDFMIAVKVWTGSGEWPEDIKQRYAKPDVKYIDSLQRRINEVLQKDARPFVRY